MMQPFLQRLGAVGATAGSYQSLLREVQLLHRALSCLCDRPASSLQQETTTQSSTSTLHQFQGLASHRHRHATTLAAVCVWTNELCKLHLELFMARSGSSNAIPHMHFLCRLFSPAHRHLNRSSK
jgi:hypothetical protein